MYRKKPGATIKDWCIAAAVTVGTLAVVFSAAYGAFWLQVDKAAAIVNATNGKAVVVVPIN